MSNVDSNIIKHSRDVSNTNSNEEGLDAAANFISSTSFNSFDDIFKVIGEFGSYQKVVYLLCSVTYVMTAMQLLGWVFIGAKTPVRCILPLEKNLTKADLRYSDFKENTSYCSICKIPPSIWLPNRQNTKDHLFSNKSFLCL